MSERKGRTVPHEVLCRFPTAAPTVRTLFDQDEEFRELCVDYVECMAVLDRLRRGQGAANEQIEQYSELRMDLERELLDLISASPRAWAGSPKSDDRSIGKNQ